MQAAIGSVVSSSLLCRSTGYQYNPLYRVCSSTKRRSFQHLRGHQSSTSFTSSRISVPVVRMASSSTEKVEEVKIDRRNSVDGGTNSWSGSTSLALLGSGASFALTALGARAEEVVVDTSAQATEGAADTLLGVLFTAAFIGLSILTIGVVYLSVTDWLEKRERDALAKTAASDQDKLGAPVKNSVERFTPKGFGKKIEKSEKDKKVEQKS